MRRSNEPLWWVPFAGGMMIDAMVIPALIVITGILLPFGIIDVESIRQLLLHPLTRAAMFVIISLTFFHAAHRLRFALPDLGLRALKPVLGFILYGGAILATLVTGAIALQIIQ